MKKTHKSRNKSKTNNKNYVNEIRVKVPEFKSSRDRRRRKTLGLMMYIKFSMSIFTILFCDSHGLVPLM